MLPMHGLSYGPALTRNTKGRASVCQSDQVGIRPPRVTTHTILTRTIFSSMSFIPNCRAEYIISSLNLLAERTPAPFYQSFLQSSCRAGLYNCTLVSVKMIYLLFLTFSALVANPKKTTLHGGQSRSWSAEQGKKIKNKKSGSAPPPPRAARSDKNKIKIKG